MKEEKETQQWVNEIVPRPKIYPHVHPFLYSITYFVPMKIRLNICLPAYWRISLSPIDHLTICRRTNSGHRRNAQMVRFCDLYKKFKTEATATTDTFLSQYYTQRTYDKLYDFSEKHRKQKDLNYVKKFIYISHFFWPFSGRMQWKTMKITTKCYCKIKRKQSLREICQKKQSMPFRSSIGRRQRNSRKEITIRK